MTKTGDNQKTNIFNQLTQLLKLAYYIHTRGNIQGVLKFMDFHCGISSSNFPLSGYRTVGNFRGSNFSWFGELRRFRGFISLWHTYHLVI